MTTPNEQSSREQELRGLLREWQQAYNRMDDVGVSVADFQSLRRRTHEALSSPIAITAEEAGREGEAVQLREVHRLLTNAIPFRLGLIERSSSRAEAEVNCERIREMLATVLAELPPAQGGQE